MLLISEKFARAWTRRGWKRLHQQRNKDISGSPEGKEIQTVVGNCVFCCCLQCRAELNSGAERMQHESKCANGQVYEEQIIATSQAPVTSLTLFNCWFDIFLFDASNPLIAQYQWCTSGWFVLIEKKTRILKFWSKDVDYFFHSRLVS